MTVSVERLVSLPDRRSPTGLVWVRLPGGIVAAFTIRHQRRGQLVLAAPEAADRSDGVKLPPEVSNAVRDAVEAALADAPEMRKALARTWTPLPLRVHERR